MEQPQSGDISTSLPYFPTDQANFIVPHVNSWYKKVSMLYLVMALTLQKKMPIISEDPIVREIISKTKVDIALSSSAFMALVSSTYADGWELPATVLKSHGCTTIVSWLTIKRKNRAYR